MPVFGEGTPPGTGEASVTPDATVEPTPGVLPEAPETPAEEVAKPTPAAEFPDGIAPPSAESGTTGDTGPKFDEVEPTPTPVEASEQSTTSAATLSHIEAMRPDIPRTTVQTNPLTGDAASDRAEYPAGRSLDSPAAKQNREAAARDRATMTTAREPEATVPGPRKPQKNGIIAAFKHLFGR